jgi:hypothetical protein
MTRSKPIQDTQFSGGTSETPSKANN